MRALTAITALLAVVAAILVSGLSLSGHNPEHAPARRGDIVHSFVALGRVESDRMVDVIPEVSSRILHVLVREGDHVKRGQLLVVLDDELLRAQHEVAQRAAEAAQAHWNEISRGTRPELVERARGSVEEAQADVNQADARLAELLRGPRPEDLRNAESLVEAARADRDAAESEWRRIQSLEGTVADTEVDRQRGRFGMAVAMLKSRQAELDRLKNGATVEKISQARATVAAARARLKQAEAELKRLTEGATFEERKAAEAEYKQAQARLQETEAAQARARIESPLAGIVLRRYKEPGEMAYAQMPTPILVLADAANRKVRVEIEEGDLYKARVGQPVEITADGYAGHTWRGKIVELASVMGNKNLFSHLPKERTDVKVLEAWIEPAASLDLPFNLPVEVRMVELVRKNVLLIPVRAVDDYGRVRLLDGTQREVNLGARDDGYVEVVSGLQAGDHVVMAK